MNRSYSKLRHIQESNIRLEKRLLMEVETENYNKLGQELNILIDGEVLDEVESCSLDEIGGEIEFNLKPESKTLLGKVRERVKQLINARDREGLKRFLNEYRQKTKDNKMETNEQVGAAAVAVTIFGITAPLWAWVAIGGIILILLIRGIINLTSWIPKKRGKGCNKRVTYRVS